MLPPPQPPPLPPARRGNCLWIGTGSCFGILLFLAALVVILVLLAKFVWDLHIEKWL